MVTGPYQQTSKNEIFWLLHKEQAAQVQLILVNIYVHEITNIQIVRCTAVPDMAKKKIKKNSNKQKNGGGYVTRPKRPRMPRSRMREHTEKQNIKKQKDTRSAHCPLPW